MRKIFGGLGKAVKWGGVTFALIFGLLLAINAVDEDPSPELEALLAIPQIRADAANGYPALIGATAPVNQDMVSYGAEWIDAYNVAGDKAAINETNHRFPYSARLKFLGDYKQLCNPSKVSCLPQVREHANVWRKLAADNEMVLARQQRLLKFTNFEENYFPPSLESPLPDHGTSFRRLALDLIALDAAEGRLESALAALESRIAFDRRALLGSRLLLTGMLSTSWLKEDYALLAEIVAIRPNGLAAQNVRLARMTEPLSIDQVRGIALRLLEGEFRTLVRWRLSDGLDVFSVTGWQDSDALLNMMAKPLFKTRASQNLEARYHTALQARVRNFSPEVSDAWFAQARQDDQNEIDAIYSWRFLYNPIVKYGIAAHGWPEYESYVLRLSDLMGVIRLARLQVEAVLAGKDTDVSALVAANKALYDPYTEKPMSWDVDKRQLGFDAHGTYSKEFSKHIRAGI